MFTHCAKIQLKPNSFIELSGQIHRQVMPALRRRKGFCPDVTSIDTIRLTAIEDTCWKTREDAENYGRAGYPETLKALSAMIEAEPVTSIFEAPEARPQAGKTY